VSRRHTVPGREEQLPLLASICAVFSGRDGRRRTERCHQPANIVAQPELYRDILHVLFTFLSKNEFAFAARTQKRWLAAAISMKSHSDFLALQPLIIQRSNPCSPHRCAIT
jgi:hypothetical protein